MESIPLYPNRSGQHGITQNASNVIKLRQDEVPRTTLNYFCLFYLHPYPGVTFPLPGKGFRLAGVH